MKYTLIAVANVEASMVPAQAVDRLFGHSGRWCGITNPSARRNATKIKITGGLLKMKIANHVIEEYDEESGKYILIDIEEGRLFNINDSAHEIVCSIKQYGDLTGYYKLMKSTGISQTVLQQDASRFLDMLIEKGYIAV